MHPYTAVGGGGTDRFDVWGAVEANHVFTVRPEANPAFAEGVIFTRFEDSFAAVLKASQIGRAHV